MPNLDIEYLKYIIGLDNVLRTTGWEHRRNSVIGVLRCVTALDDNGYDTIVSALLNSAGTDRHRLYRSPFYAQYSEAVETQREQDETEALDDGS